MAASTEFATFGPVHLEVVDRDRSLAFWRDVVGLEVAGDTHDGVELGAGGEVLVVLHPVATGPARRGHGGLYHLAIHLPDEPEFARVLARLIALRHQIAPTDHVMSKAIYLDDPDGLGLELTLETPERLGEYRLDEAVPHVVDAAGRISSGREPLDVEQVLAALPDRDYMRPMPAGTTIGHVHMHVGDLAAAVAFYRDGIGFTEHVVAPRIGMADLHAGGRFPHRLALNTWQGEGVSQPPPGTARMRHFTIRLDSEARLEEVTGRLADVERSAAASVARDPAGNTVLLTVQP